MSVREREDASDSDISPVPVSELVDVGIGQWSFIGPGSEKK